MLNSGRWLCQMDDCPFFFVLLVDMYIYEEHWLSKASAEYVKSIYRNKKIQIVWKWRSFFATLWLFDRLHNVLHINICMSHSCETIIVHWTNFTIVNKHRHTIIMTNWNTLTFLFFSLSLFLFLVLLHFKWSLKEYFRFIFLLCRHIY